MFHVVDARDPVMLESFLYGSRYVAPRVCGSGNLVAAIKAQVHEGGIDTLRNAKCIMWWGKHSHPCTQAQVLPLRINHMQLKPNVL